MQRQLKAVVERLGDFVCLDLVIPLGPEILGQDKSEFALLVLMDLSSLETQVFFDRLCFSVNQGERSGICTTRLWSVLVSGSNWS